MDSLEKRNYYIVTLYFMLNENIIIYVEQKTIK